MKVILFLFVTFCAVGAGSIFWAAISATRMMWHFKTSSDRFSSKTLWNPMNGLLAPDLLTPEGKSLRRHVGYAVAAFVGSLVLAGLTALTAKVMT